MNVIISLDDIIQAAQNAKQAVADEHEHNLRTAVADILREAAALNSVIQNW
jgi:hypothetical protein